jgi:hypothetical protein
MVKFADLSCSDCPCGVYFVNFRFIVSVMQTIYIACKNIEQSFQFQSVEKARFIARMS